MFILFYRKVYDGIFQHKFFFILVGWGRLMLTFKFTVPTHICIKSYAGIPIPFAALSAVLSYKNYDVQENEDSIA